MHDDSDIIKAILSLPAKQQIAFNQLSDSDQQLMLDYYDEIEYLDNN